MPRILPLRTFLVLTLLLPSLRADPASARLVLRDIAAHDSTFMRIHAAEVLINFGEGAEIRRQFLSELPGSESAIYRVGVWRVLAETAPTPAERAPWVAKIEHITHLVGDTDRFRSIESLGKLQVKVTGSTLEMMRQLARESPPALQAMPRWALVLAGDPGALDGLASLLDSPDPVARQLSAYALRWLQRRNPKMLRRLTVAADREPANTVAYPFLVAAAYMLHANSGQMPAWREKLEHLPAGSTEDAQWEACQALLPTLDAADLARAEHQLHDPSNSIRVGAAWMILYAASRKGP